MGIKRKTQIKSFKRGIEIELGKKENAKDIEKHFDQLFPENKEGEFKIIIMNILAQLCSLKDSTTTIKAADKEGIFIIL